MIRGFGNLHEPPHLRGAVPLGTWWYYCFYDHLCAKIMSRATRQHGVRVKVLLERAYRPVCICIVYYCCTVFLLKILSTNTVGDHSVPTVTRLVAFFGRFLTFRTLPQLDSNWYNNIALKYHVYSHPQVL